MGERRREETGGRGEIWEREELVIGLRREIWRVGREKELKEREGLEEGESWKFWRDELRIEQELEEGERFGRGKKVEKGERFVSEKELKEREGEREMELGEVNWGGRN